MVNLATSDLMELYEYKLATMGHAERAATANMEAASQMCTHLQHRTAQLTAELSRLHQLLFHTQQCHEDASKKRDILQINNKDMSNRLEAEKGRYKAVSSQLAIKEKALMETEKELEVTQKKLEETDSALSTLDEQNNNLKRVLDKLEDNLKKKEKLVEKRDDQLAKANLQLESYRKVSYSVMFKIYFLKIHLSNIFK